MQTSLNSNHLELWGGIECTRNRVGDVYHDQFQMNGHVSRIDDLDRVAELGIRTLRYPMLWEWAARSTDNRFDWTWADVRLQRLQQLQIRPIVGFLHHGSGPTDVSLLDATLPDRLSAYADEFAQRYPEVEFYTPVNEPLTTARFSALYGHWYPHCRDDLSFATAFLNQCRATVLAMQTIRRIRPDAKLVQPEDLGKTFSSPSIAYQADFDNERRWLTFDVLAGRVDRVHPLGDFFLWAGIPEEDLKWFVNNPCPPDILGINYYVTSERFLKRLPGTGRQDSLGGNRRHRYADLEAVRVRSAGLFGIRALLLEAWERYRRPLAVTEAHLGCSREDQLRWLYEIYREASAARASGADVRAVTAWSLFGAYDWDTLVTQVRGRYEPGAFDVRGPAPRPTAVAGLVRELANAETPSHPVLEQEGWWKRPHRLLFDRRPRRKVQAQAMLPGRPILITGAKRSLAQAFARVCLARGLPYRILKKREINVADPDAVSRVLRDTRPWVVINTSDFEGVDAAERNIERCYLERVTGPRNFAANCMQHGLQFVTFSSDYVFDGAQRTPYGESAATNPLGVYGRAQVEGEQRVREALPNALIIRSSTCFGPWDEQNSVFKSYLSYRQRRPCAILQRTVSPTYLPDLVHACLDLIIDRASGIWHLAGEGEISWPELVREVVQRAGALYGEPHVRLLDEKRRAPRPLYGVLASEKGLRLPHWSDALDRYIREMGPTFAASTPLCP